MDMKRWQIDWDSGDNRWDIAYFGDGVTVSAHYDAEYVQQDPIMLYFKNRKTIREPWPWNHDTSPSPIRVMRQLFRLAEIHGTAK